MSAELAAKLIMRRCLEIGGHPARHQEIARHLANYLNGRNGGIQELRRGGGPLTDAGIQAAREAHPEWFTTTARQLGAPSDVRAAGNARERLAWSNGDRDRDRDGML